MSNSVPYLLKPGLHSHNLARTSVATAVTPANAITRLRMFFLFVGLLCLGYFAYTVANEKIYQSYQNWAFDKQLAVHKSEPAVPAPPLDGSIIGRVTVDRLNLSAVVRQGVDDQTLKEAVGHVPSSALPGQTGNFAIAAHRDTLFRGLKDIKLGDRVTFQTQTGLFHYEVAATKIVKPSDVSVISPNGGGLVSPGDGKLLTMITCYPFYYVGSAPKRFIVQAKLVD